MPETAHPIEAHAVSISDALGYRGQQAIAQAVANRGEYSIIGGHMVRLLLLHYPTPHATLRSTTDTDIAVGSVDVITPSYGAS